MTKVSICCLLLISHFCFAQLISSSPLQQELRFQQFKMKAYNGDSIVCQLSKINVPENRLSQHSKTIQLSILKLKSKSKTHAFPIVFLAGGPGQSGINYIKQEYFQALVFKLQEDHDIILLDQRGSGSSVPSLIYPVPASDKKDIFLSSSRIIQLSNQMAQIGSDTLKKRGIDILGYNTVQNADDLNDLRVILGETKINLLAISYGTHLALAAARRYPEYIDNMVLIGTSGLNDMHHLPFTYDKQLHSISDLASQDTAINKQVPDMIALLQKTLSKLDQKPVYVEIRDKKADKVISIGVGQFGLQMILRLDAADSYDFVYFPAMLYGIDQGNYELLQEYAEKRYNQFNGDYGSGIGVMRTASGATKERYRTIKEQGKTALLGNAMNTPDIYTTNCFGDVDLGDDFRKPFTSKIRTLFVSGTLDSNTPASNAEDVNKKFTNATHVLVQYAGHEDMLPDETVQQKIVNFFRHQEIESDDIILPKPKFEPIVKD